MNKTNLIGKRLLILGGMRFSCEIVNTAKALGIYTLVADYNKIEDSPGKQIADEIRKRIREKFRDVRHAQ